MPPPRLILRHLAPSRRPTTSASKASPILPLHQQTRHESTTRKHKKLLYVPPAPSYTPTSSYNSPAPQFLYNPPSAAPSVYHTPLKFLPPGDKRRALFAQHQAEVARKQMQERVSPVAMTGTPLSAPSVVPTKSALRSIAQANTTYLRKTRPSEAPTTTPEAGLPPPIRPPYEKKYHVTAEQMEEMRALRRQDPDHWTRARLAEKYDCSQFLVGLVAPNAEKGARMEAEHQKVREKWGQRRRLAREDKVRRRALWGRDA